MSGTRVFLQTMITLASASLGLVAALAWNEAIKATIKKVLGEGDSLAALYNRWCGFRGRSQQSKV